MGMNKSDFGISIAIDKDARTLTISDNGIGMTKEELEEHLGTIANSGSLQFKKENNLAEDNQIIGQFGVGFYSAFMVAKCVTVKSRAFGADQAYVWQSEGVEGYTIDTCDKDTVGTEITLELLPDVAGDEDGNGAENYSEYLDQYRIQSLIKRYSDYIRFPIRMEMTKSRKKEDSDEYEDYTETVTLNSMVPLWHKNKSEITEEEYNTFYRDKCGDYTNPLCHIHVHNEGSITYDALLYIPEHAPFNYYNKDYEKGLQLYANGVLIMDRCEDLLPDYFSFVKGLVDSEDLSLNISREMLQHDRQLKIIANNIEKKVKNELVKLMKDDRTKYEQFWAAFGMQFKYALMNSYGQNRDTIRDLLLFWSSKENKLTSLKEYVDRMPTSQEKIYYVCADSVDHASKMPQAERVLKAGYEVLYLTVDEDEIVLQMLENAYDKPFISVANEDALPVTDAEKASAEQAEKDHKDLLDFAQETLKGYVSKVRISKILKSGTVCLTADGPVSLEMEKYFHKMRRDFPMSAEKVLELNPESSAFQALCKAYDEDKEKAKNYIQVLYYQALIIADLPLPDPAHYAELVCGLMQ